MRRCSARARGWSPGCQGALVASLWWTITRSSMTPVVVRCPAATAASTRAILLTAGRKAGAESRSAHRGVARRASTSARTSALHRGCRQPLHEPGWGWRDRRGSGPVVRQSHRLPGSRCRGVRGSAVGLAGCRARRCGRRSRRHGSAETIARAGWRAWKRLAPWGSMCGFAGALPCPRVGGAVLYRSGRDCIGAAISGW